MLKWCMLLVLIVFINHSVSAQKDTIRIMQYNLLNYGNAANPVSYKNIRLKTIVQYVNPDIFGANEIRNLSTLPQEITDSVLGAGWSHGTYMNTNNEVQVNMLFWKTAKFGLKSQVSISHQLRDIIAFNLYYKDTITHPHDTVFLTVIVAHLRASNTSQDAASRAAETQTVVDYLDNLNKGGNYIFMGDMNLYTSNEDAYQNIVTNPNLKARLYDPINRPGDWSGDASFSDIHTQSTRSGSLSDGGASGGLDDRFDHQVVSGFIMNDSAGVKYIPGTYHTAGQDGQHFNKSVNASPVNAAVPANVAQALYEMSDHLPVYANYQITPGYQPASGSGIEQVLLTADAVQVVNPVHDVLDIRWNNNLAGHKLHLQLFSLMGRPVFEADEMVTELHRQTQINAAAGMYLLYITDDKGNRIVKKLLAE